MTLTAEADATTGTDAYEDGTDAPGVCWDCGGPCLTYKGSEHGWRCRACVDAYLDAGERAWQTRSAKARDKISRNLLHSNDNRAYAAAEARRRDGGAPSYVPTAAPASADSHSGQHNDQHHREGINR